MERRALRKKAAEAEEKKAAREKRKLEREAKRQEKARNSPSSSKGKTKARTRTSQSANKNRKINRQKNSNSGSGGRQESLRVGGTRSKLPIWVNNKLNLMTLTPDHVVMAIIEDREFPCYVKSIDAATEAVEVRFQDGDTQVFDVRQLAEPAIATRKKMEMLLRKEKRNNKHMQEKPIDATLLSSPSSSSLDNTKKSNIISGKNISTLLNEVDKGSGTMKNDNVGDEETMNTVLDGITMRNGGLFFPRWIGDNVQHEIVDVNHNIKLHRRLSTQDIVYELEVNGNEEIHFNIDFTDSKNVQFIDNPFSMKKSIIVKPRTWKEVCFLNVVDRDQPWELHSSYTWNVKNYIYDPNFGCCGGARFADNYDYNEKDVDNGGCIIA
jgi:hypothetical protein